MLGGFIRPRHIANFLKHQPGDNIGDRWRAWLRSQGAKGFNTHDLEIQWLRSQGYTGTFADMFYAKFGDRDGAREYFNSGGFFTDFAKTTFLSETMTDNKLRNLTLYGRSTQAGTPTPDAPVPIVSTTGDVTVRSDSKNLIISDRGGFTQNGITYTPSPDGAVSVNGTASGHSIYRTSILRHIRIVAGVTYTLSGNPLAGSPTTFYMELECLNDDGTTTHYGTISFKDRTFTATKSGWAFFYITVRTGFVADNLIFKPQLEVGSTATDFEKNTTSTQTLPLGTTQLRSLPNGVSDRIYKDGSTWKLEQNIGTQTITGGATGAVAMTNGTQFIITVTPLASLGDDSVIQVTSDRFIGIKRADRETVANSIYSFPSQDTLRINTTIASDTTTFNDWLATNQPVIQYILATPITTPITDPTLITALENIRTYQGITNITAGTPISGQYPRP